MKEARNKDEEAVDPASPAKESSPQAPLEPKKPAGLGYVFKIAPADPKNSFDFEDVADK
jgi:hypothetical protein